jgi:hypothetical protein
MTDIVFFGGLFGGMILVAIIGICAGVWAHIRKAELDARFKQDMLARGLPVEDIVRLVQVQPGAASPFASSYAPPGERPSSATLSLAKAIESMVEAGQNTDDIAALLDAFLQRGEGPHATSAERPSTATRGVAAALYSMANNKTTEEVAAFLETFLQRNGGSQEAARKSKEAAREPVPPPEQPEVVLRSVDIQRFGSGRDG